ncbi:MAG: hypothetical protein J2P20_01975 [Pseudonocardia sp.]|nr:hypothetical protein [Pseudonocardia sp.]MBO0877540.1 hypothetical protein [Pseudonocardia sp.]
MVESVSPCRWSQYPADGGRRRQQLREAAARLLAEYVDAVASALRAEGLSVADVRIRPGSDLGAELTLVPADPLRDGVPGRVELAWAEDTGWCLSHHLLGPEAAPWRYLHIELAPSPETVARFVAATLYDREDVGMLYPERFRFRGQPIQPVIDALARQARLAHPAGDNPGSPAIDA